jgi:hypothetical protein
MSIPGVEALLKQLNNDQAVGRNWVTKFIHRHPDGMSPDSQVRTVN